RLLKFGKLLAIVHGGTVGQVHAKRKLARKPLLALTWAFGLALGAPWASAQPKAQPSAEDVATARALGRQGLAALQQKDFVSAEELFGRADALYHVSTLTLGRARAQVGLGKLVAAHEAYQRIVREGVPAGAGSAAVVQAVEDAKREKATIEA